MIPLLAGAASAASFHPPFPVLDPAGVSVLTSGNPWSPVRTCGACHDADAIDRHATHVSAGASDVGPRGAQGLPWEWGPGPLGRWDADWYRPSDPSDLLAWAMTYGQDHVGGGPLAPLGVETDCALCHLAEAAPDARRTALATGDLALADTATLAHTGLVTLDPTLPTGLAWDAAAFDADGRFPTDRLTLGPARAEACGTCHGTVYRGTDPLTRVDGRRTRHTGLIFSGQRMDRSGLNLADKATLDRPWDVHAERLLECADCHAAGDRPSRQVDADAPAHLRFDPRTAPLGEYLRAPSHRLSADGASCTACHDPDVGHGFLPGREVHFGALACAACHIPDVRFTARQQLDWTSLDAHGDPLVDWRGTDGAPDDPRALQAGYTPILLPVDGKLTPHQVSSTFLWVSNGAPVPRVVLGRVWANELDFASFDVNRDGRLDDVERRLDTPEKEARAKELLVAAGVEDPRIVGLVEAFPVSHGVARGTAVTRQCTSCHAPGGRLDQGLEVAAWVPGGVMPELRGDAATRLQVELRDGAAWVSPPASERYVFGSAGFVTLDRVGLAAFVGAWLFAIGHGGLRWWAGRRPAAAKGGAS